MNRNDMRYSQYVSILKEELVPAMGCTEPIAIAYGASIAAGVLEQLPQKVLIEASGSIIKNVKSVIVPNTHHLKGMSAAAASGIIAGDPSRKLEVISDVCEEKKCQIEQFLNTAVFEEKFLDSDSVFDLRITLYANEHHACVQIKDTHTNVILIEKDGEVILHKDSESKQSVRIILY